MSYTRLGIHSFKIFLNKVTRSVRRFLKLYVGYGIKKPLKEKVAILFSTFFFWTFFFISEDIRLETRWKLKRNACERVVINNMFLCLFLPSFALQECKQKQPFTCITYLSLIGSRNSNAILFNTNHS